jgi:hypothetical protein
MAHEPVFLILCVTQPICKTLPGALEGQAPTQPFTAVSIWAGVRPAPYLHLLESDHLSMSPPG